MAQELIYTSVPNGLLPGRKGYSTVAATRGLPDGMMRQLESLSAYRHIHQAGSAEAAANPTVFSHLTLDNQGQQLSLLSRISDTELDYSGRSNYLAHHLALSPVERSPAGPASILAAPSLLKTQWSGEPAYIDAARELPPVSEASGPFSGCQRLGLDAGWAGELARLAQDTATPLAHLVVSTEMSPHLLALLEDATSLLSPQVRWRFTFTTYYTSLPPNVDCCLRFVIEGTNEATAARGNSQVPCLDLTRPGELPFPDHPLVRAAQAGQRYQTPTRPAAEPDLTAGVTPAGGGGGDAWSPTEAGGASDDFDQMMADGVVEPATEEPQVTGLAAPPVPLTVGPVTVAKGPATPVTPATPAIPPTGVRDQDDDYDYDYDDIEPGSRRRREKGMSLGWIAGGGVLAVGLIVIAIVLVMNVAKKRNKDGRGNDQVANKPVGKPNTPVAPTVPPNGDSAKGNTGDVDPDGSGTITPGDPLDSQEADPKAAPKEPDPKEPDPKAAPPVFQVPDATSLTMGDDATPVTVSAIKPGSDSRSAMKDLRCRVKSLDPGSVTVALVDDGAVNEAGKARILISPRGVADKIAIEIHIADIGPDGKLNTADDVLSKTKKLVVNVQPAVSVSLARIDVEYPDVSFAERVVADYDRSKFLVTYKVGKNIRGLANRICVQRESSFGGLLSKPMTVVVSQPSKPKLELRLDDGETLYYGRVTSNHAVLLNKNFPTDVQKFLKSDTTKGSEIEDHFVGYVTDGLVFRTQSGDFFTGYSPRNNVVIKESFDPVAGGYSIDWNPNGGVNDIPLRILREEMEASDLQQLVMVGEIGEGPNMIEFGKHRWPEANYLIKPAGSFQTLMRTAPDTCVYYSLTASYKEQVVEEQKVVTPSSGILGIHIQVLKVSDTMNDDQFVGLQGLGADILTLDLVGSFDSARNAKEVSVDEVKRWAARTGFSLGPDQDKVAMVIKVWFDNKASTAQQDLLNDLFATRNSPPAGFEKYDREDVKLATKFWKHIKPVYEAQRQFDTSKPRLAARICRLATFIDERQPDTLTHVYVPIVELSSDDDNDVATK